MCPVRITVHVCAGLSTTPRMEYITCNRDEVCVTMATLESRRLGISEVSETLGVPVHMLRQWEARFPQLKPRRDRANHRYYTAEDVRVARRIKQLLWDEKMTTEGAKRRLAQEMRGEGRPETRQEVTELLDKIEAEARAMLALLDDD